MKYIILGIYDGWYYCSCNINGVFHDYDSKICRQLYNIYCNHDNTYFKNYLLKEYSDYDLIAICENGEIDILKGVK